VCAALILAGIRQLLSADVPHSLRLASGSQLLPLVGDAKQRFAGPKGPSLLRTLLGSRDSRRLAAFLGLNLLFMGVELLYGFLTNSLALLSDAGHMLFDCAAIAIGLYASFAARWPRDAGFGFGYGRCELVCSFVNALLLLLTAASVCIEALHRLGAPPEIDDRRLLAVASLGLAVNLIGVGLFREHYFGGDGGAAGCGHVHAGSSCGGGNDNLRAVAMHIFADAMGSVGAIVSSLLIRHKRWRWADPVCSILIAVLIACSAWPLLRRSATLLLLHVPREVGDAFAAALVGVPQVLAPSEARFWMHTSGQAAGLVTVLAEGGSEERVANDVASALREVCPLVHVSVQVQQRGTLLGMEPSDAERNSRKTYP